MAFARFAYLLPQIAEQIVKGTKRDHISALRLIALGLGSGVGLVTISRGPRISEFIERLVQAPS